MTGGEVDTVTVCQLRDTSKCAHHRIAVLTESGARASAEESTKLRVDWGSEVSWSQRCPV